METLAVQPQTEKLRSFDPLASARMFQYDLEHFGQVFPETRQRVCDEELSYLVEATNRAACTSFVLTRNNENELVYFNKGKWQPYLSTLHTGLQTARAEAAQDYRRNFLLRRAIEDLSHGLALQTLGVGEVKSWFSPYADAEEASFGTEFMQECGFQTSRKMGFIYRAECLEDGSIHLQSQTVDRSEAAAFAAAQSEYENNPNSSMEKLTDAYDAVLSSEYGGKQFKAGRTAEEHQGDGWEAINRNKDLIEYHLNELERIASVYSGTSELEKRIKQHTIGVWATFKKRLDGLSQPSQVTPNYDSNEPVYSTQQYQLLAIETQANYRELARTGITIVGCGGAIRLKGETDLLNADMGDVFDSIFNDPDSDSKGSLTFYCPDGHRNRRPRGRLLTACQRSGCKAKVTC